MKASFYPINHDEPLVLLAEELGASLIVTHDTAHLQPATKRGIQVSRSCHQGNSWRYLACDEHSGSKSA